MRRAEAELRNAMKPVDMAVFLMLLPRKSLNALEPGGSLGIRNRRRGGVGPPPTRSARAVRNRPALCSSGRSGTWKASKVASLSMNATTRQCACAKAMRHITKTLDQR
eukprot:3810598-Prymnesium_polylepis.2